jgi:uncharacterized protein YndB with AHSA1/START domain
MKTEAEELTIRKSVTVDCSVEHAWETFTQRIHEWWPLEVHSIQAGEDRGRPKTLKLEGERGGRVYEVTTDGEELTWAEITAWEQPTRLVLAWNPSRDQTEPRTEIEVRFTAEDGATRVDLEHRGWERLGERGAEVRSGYDQGWPPVLERFREATSRSRKA